MKTKLSLEAMGMRVYKEIPEGAVVNLGGGMPTYLTNVAFLSEEKTIIFHSENGILGFGRPFSRVERELRDIDLMTATAQFVAQKPGMCIVNHRESFDMIRGGHIDITVLGAYQVSEKGDLANIMAPGGKARWPSPGGGVDLATNCKRVFVMMEHVTREEKPRILGQCTYPLTAPHCVDMIFTDLAVIAVTTSGLVLKEVAPGWTADEVQAATEAKLYLAKDIKKIGT